MRKFTIKTLLLLLPLVIIALSMEFFLRQIPNVYAYKKQYLDNHAGEIQTLVLGHSHPYCGIDPACFSMNTFNASNPSQLWKFDFEILKKYRHNLTQLKTIMLPVSYFSFWGNLETGSEAGRIKEYVIHFGMDSLARSLVDHTEVLSNKLHINIKKLYQYYVKNKYPRCSELGWGLRGDKTTEDLEKKGKIAAVRHSKNIFSEQRINNLNDNIGILDAIAIFFEKQKVELILITYPAYHTYRENLNSDQLAAMYKTVNQFVETHDNCRYIDLLSDSTFVAEDFYDADHLNEKGAQKLSKFLQDYFFSE